MSISSPERRHLPTAPAVGGPVVAGRYQLKDLLGRGTLAQVFRAADLDGGPDVAVKVAVDDSAKHFERISNEAAVLAALRHPSIVRFIGLGVVPGGTALAGRPFARGVAWGGAVSLALAALALAQKGNQVPFIYFQF